jgi:hypothetical protein
MKALIPFMNGTIPKENTFFRTKLKFAIFIGTEMRPAHTTEHLKKHVIRNLTKQEFKRSIHTKEP